MNHLPEKESQTIEFKTSFNEDVIETLVAFSNAKGGTLYLGISDNAKITGITVGKETIQNWINEIKNKTNPQIIPDVETLLIDEKTIAAFFIPEYPIKPVSVRGRYYKRIDTANHLLSANEVSNMHLQTINSSWDYYPRPNKSIKDISLEKVKKAMNVIKKSNNSIIKIFPDRILFFNPEVLPDTITIEQLQTNQYVSTPRNRQIAKTIKEMGIAEHYGTGIKRVQKMFVDYGLKEPVFEMISGGVAVTVFAENVPENKNNTEKVGEKVTENQQKILGSISENPYVTAQELAVIAGISKRKIEENLSKLKSKGLIERIGADKGGYWQIKAVK